LIGNLLIATLVVGLVVHAVFVAYKARFVLREADEVWLAYRDENAREIEGLDELGFRRAYFRAHGPLGMLHAYAGLALAAILTVPALLLLGGVWEGLWRVTGKSVNFRPGELMWQAYLFFALIITWVAVAGGVMRRYHRHRPRALRYELARERERARVATSVEPKETQTEG
jgi:hypothetical protein